MDKPILTARAVSKYFETTSVRTFAVNDVSVSVSPGEYLVLTGPSGCGKSTLLSLLGLLEPVSSGEIFVEDANIASLSELQKAKLRGLTLGFVFQSFHLIPQLTVLDNIRLPLQFHRVLTVEQQEAVANAAASEVGMADRLGHFPDQLSGGQQQRVAIARALAGKPRVILADEPTGNLDSENGDQIMRLLAKLHEQGAAICLVTHDPRYQGAGQRTLHMRDGRIVDDVRR